MSRIATRFETLRSHSRKALIPYITAGDPQPDVIVPLMHALVDAGADLLELGVPFSDPMADGPVIQAACERALKHHVSLRQVMDMVKAFRQTDNDTPVILMGYLNPIEVMGYETFAEAAQSAGVDGVLTVDLPPEEGCDLVAALKTHRIDSIFLAAPTSSDERIRLMAKNGGGFLYYVSFKGVTGANQLDVKSVQDKLKQIRRNTDLPVGVGFGIRDAASAARVAAVADAVVVGSALVTRIAALADEPDRIAAEAPQIIAEMRAAMDAD
ncbi:Tryptophan synthase alpha chain [hydrothermal vent metagenome]|uniref:tryptophan synthase n=1 Tax=hydrothermal vent metagenome TaxID=652676 RepID=A0A3B0YH38_9ZZZZ